MVRGKRVPRSIAEWILSQRITLVEDRNEKYYDPKARDDNASNNGVNKGKGLDATDLEEHERATYVSNASRDPCVIVKRFFAYRDACPKAHITARYLFFLPRH
jgi:hypothetical protein